MPTEQDAKAIRWRALNYPMLLREEWEDEYFLFNPASGNTHVLNRLAIEILDRLSTGSATSDELVRTLLPGDAPGEEEHYRVHLQQHLSHLDQLGLITPDDT